MKDKSSAMAALAIDPHRGDFVELLWENDLLDLLPVAAYTCDLDGVIMACNKEAALLLGSQKVGNAEQGKNGFRFCRQDGEYIPHNETPTASCLADGQTRKGTQIILERPDHTRLFVRLDVSPLRDKKGKQLGAISCLYDISEQKAAEKESLRQTRELQDYVDNANIGLHWVDADGIIIWANKAELDMLGYSPDEYIGHQITEFHISQEKIGDILTQLKNNKVLYQYESELRAKDGSIRHVQISSSAFREEGRFIHTRCFTIDVTAQKKARRALADSQLRYEHLVNSLPVAVYTCDKDGRITFFNEVAVALWGYRPDLAEKPVKYCACYKVYVNGRFIPPDETPMAAALRTGRTFRNEQAQVERPDGSMFYASVNIDPLYDLEGNISGAINVFQDITPLKMAELGRQEIESRYQQLIQTLDMPIYTTDVEGRITLFNKAAVDLWGREPEIGKDLWCGSFKILNSDGSQVPLDTCPMALCLKEKRAIYGEQILVVRPDGSLRNVAPHPQPVFDDSGKMIGAINMLVDITNLKTKEKDLRESEERYRRLAYKLEVEVMEKMRELEKSEERYHKMVEEVDDYAIILLDRDGVIMNWNKGAEKINGYKEEEIVGKSFQEFYLPEDRQNGLPLRLLNEARTTGKAIHEGWRKRKNGTALWAHILLTALHDEHDNVIGFSKVTRDLTERKLAEDKAREYLAKLEFQNNELEQFVYVASHDLKEPLRKIHLYNSFVTDNPLNVLDAKSIEYLQRSTKAAKRMKNLIDDLLTYSRATVNGEAYEEVDLDQLLDEVLSFHGEEFEQKRIIVEKGELRKIRGVPFQLKQLFSNLIDNAIKYKHPDRIPQIRVTGKMVRNTELASLQENWQQYYKISVKDNGIGFSPQHAERIFEIFQRLSPSTEVSGSGIGLAICSKIIQNHNGYIKADGEPGIGATFHIYIPK